jgi:hypothetical protein
VYIGGMLFYKTDPSDGQVELQDKLGQRRCIQYVYLQIAMMR